MNDGRLRIHDEADTGQVSINGGKGADDRMHHPHRGVCTLTMLGACEGRDIDQMRQ